MNINKLSKLLLQHIPYGGVTISNKGEVITFGIAVALNSHSTYTIRADTENTEWFIKRWLKCKAHDNSAIGMWIDDYDNIVLDQVLMFSTTDLSAALAHAHEHNQRAIQFLNQNVTMWLTEPNRRN